MPPLVGKTNKTSKKLIETPTVAAVPVAKVEKVKPVTITIKLGDKTYVGVGDTTLKALQAIEKPAKIASKGFVTIEYDGKVTDRFFRPQQMNRIFYSSPSLQAIHAKQLSHGLNGIKFA